jgi:hypothetical protein
VVPRQKTSFLTVSSSPLFSGLLVVSGKDGTPCENEKKLLPEGVNSWQADTAAGGTEN